MKSDWPRITLGELCDQYSGELQTGPFGSQLHAHDYVENGEVPVVPTSGIGRRRLISEGIPRISRSKADELSRHYLRAGDILFARRGIQAAGLSAIVEAEHEGWLCGTGAIRLRLSESSSVDPVFLSFSLADEWVYQWIQRHAIGATMPNLNEGIVRGIPIWAPPLPEQRRIAAVLGALDDKIELNRKMNRTLEQMAQTLFKSWFIDFDGHSDLVDSELGPIPPGWAVRSLLDIVLLMSGGTPKTTVSEFWNGDVKWASAKDVSNADGRYLLDTERTITDAGLRSCSTKIIPAGAVVVVARGATCGRWCLLGEAMAMNQTCYALVAHSDASATYIKHLVPALLGGLVQQAHGSIFDTITTRTFSTVKVAAPPDSVALKFRNTIECLETRIISNLRESRTLTDLRDTLLPKLISGELRIPEAEALIP